MNQTDTPFFNANDYAACLGVDWGHSSNCFHLLAAGSRTMEKREVKADAASMLAFARELRARFGGERIAVASEQAKGALTTVLLDLEFVDLFVVNPYASAEFRKSLHPSGSKSDPIDSAALLRMIYSHSDRMRLTRRGDDRSRRLDALSRLRRELVEQRVEISNRLLDHLRGSYPQALPMLGDEPWNQTSLGFLRRWPSYSKLSAAKERDVRSYYYASGCRSESSISRRLAALSSSCALSSDTALEEIEEMRVDALAEQLAALGKRIRALDAALEREFASHPDRAIFASLPGAGPAMAPRLAGGFGCDRERYRDCEQMQAHVGIAPIKLQSGGMQRTFMRRRCPKFLRQSFHEWAGLSVRYSGWAKAYYQMLRERGKSSHAAKRSLAFKWMRVVYRLWQSREPYDEAKYVRSLIARNSPIPRKMTEMGLLDPEENQTFA